MFFHRKPDSERSKDEKNGPQGMEPELDIEVRLKNLITWVENFWNFLSGVFHLKSLWEWLSVFINGFSSTFYLTQSNWDDVVDNFDDMALKETLLRGIYAYGWVDKFNWIWTKFTEWDQTGIIVIPFFDDYRFEKPSAIQQRAIIPCCKGW